MLRNKNTPRHDMLAALANQGVLAVDVKLLQPIERRAGYRRQNLEQFNLWHGGCEQTLSRLAAGQNQTLSIDLACFAKVYRL